MPDRRRLRLGRCDCGPQLCEAVEHIAGVGGVLLYLRQEGRGIRPYDKLETYALQDQGLDTYLGLPEDARDYTAAAQMLATLGIFELDLLNNPEGGPAAHPGPYGDPARSHGRLHHGPHVPARSAAAAPGRGVPGQ